MTYDCVVDEVMKEKYSKGIATVLFPIGVVERAALYKLEGSSDLLARSSRASLH